MNRPKTIAIIPARGGSKRLPQKNLLLVDGKPLLAYSIRYAQQHSDIIDAVYVSTDDPQIKAVALACGAQVIDRPEALSGDLEPTVTTLQHALEVLGEAVENIVLLQPTNPLRPANLLKDCYQTFSQGRHQSLFTVSENHHKLGRISEGRFLPFNYTPGQRSQDMEPLYFENGLLYICKAAVVRSGKVISPQAFPYVVSHVFGTLDIDTQQDLDYAAFLLKNNPIIF